MTTSTRRSAEKRTTPRSASGQWLLGLLIVLALVASIMMIWSDQLTVRASVAVIAALWAAVLGAIGIARYRRQAETAEAKSRDMRLVYELQLEREIAARHQYETDVEAQIRREVAAEANHDLRELQEQIAALRASLEALMGRELPDDRVALPNERLRELSSAISNYAADDSLLAATDFASTAPPAADGRHYPPQGGRDDLTEIIPVVEDDAEPYVSPFREPATYTVPVDADHYTIPPTSGQAYAAEEQTYETVTGVEQQPAYEPYVAPSSEQSYGGPYAEPTYEQPPVESDEAATDGQQGDEQGGGEFPTDSWVTPTAPADADEESEGGGRRRAEGQHSSGISAAELLSQLRGGRSGTGTNLPG
ncbi:DUF6779 domain-containing protein [Gordonia crocea]|uniref:DUF6779 domain-containing protein n=1 Tax=Gordonia crocea TaxID=589162 RepID=A0A7I9V1U3_9ACTN|nr:DUF6779 domain-containing protein [Gordonia crocea]GED99123.1 hypothetical protein nbrc107697_31620 [Gordonia crocea]